MKNLNLVEILKDCPKGTPLYSPLFGEMTLAKVWPEGDTDYPIEVESTKRNGEKVVDEFTADGLVDAEHDGECMLWPSRDCRDWSQFVPPEPKPEPEHEFKPFDRVLVRDCVDESWKIDFFDHYNRSSNFPYRCMTRGYLRYCIHYKGNEHLKGTTNEPKGGKQ